MKRLPGLLVQSVGASVFACMLALLFFYPGLAQTSVAQAEDVQAAEIDTTDVLEGYEITLLNQAGEPVEQLTDGDRVRIAIEVDEARDAATTFSFYLDPDVLHLDNCQIPAGDQRCTTPVIETLGWYWDEDERIRPQRLIYAIDYAETGWVAVATREVTIEPRPVVVIHGYTSTYATWEEYLGPSGYLALTGLPGYAVGDGQVPGVMQTGNKFRPAQRTNTIAQNAQVLADYIEGVKAETGAEQVDLIGHSMGGLIARYYIDRLMDQRDVAQLIMLGTPNGGSDCAMMAGTLGLYQPATLELRVNYLHQVFNPQIVETRGVPFYLVAGTPIQQRVFSPCGDVPNDLMVSLESAMALGVPHVELPVLHKDLNESPVVYFEHVAPLLRQSPQDFAQEQEIDFPTDFDPGLLQYSRVFTGTVAGTGLGAITGTAGITGLGAGVGSSAVADVVEATLDDDASNDANGDAAADTLEGAETLEGVETLPGDESNRHTIHIDRDVVVASFGLYDPSRSLTVTVQGATGNVIQLNTEDHGLNVVSDPEALFYLGYGFDNPRPGPWVVTVHATSRTPPLGAEYALVTLYAGGASIDAALSNPLPRVQEQVEVTATLELGGEPIDFDHAEVVLHHPDGTAETIPVDEAGEVLNVAVEPESPGVYGVDVNMGTTLPDGTVAARAVYLAFEALARD